MKKLIPSKKKWKNTGHGYFRKIFFEIENQQNKICKVEFVQILPNTTIKPHYHKGQTELEYVLSGSGQIKSKKQIIKLTKGTLFTVDKNEIHEVKSGKNGLLLFITKANYSDDTEWCE